MFDFSSQVALKIQQAVEDAIALRLASNESGASLEVLPQGKIFGMNVTEPCVSPNKTQPEPEKSKPSKFLFCVKSWSRV